MELAVPTSQSLDIVLLRTFLEVVDSGGFALAADNLALTPSAVSGHIKRLEQTAGVSLLSRTTRRLELTQAGETLYAYARNIVELEREARARLHGTPIRDRLRIGASEDFASAWLPRVLQRFRRWHPKHPSNSRSVSPPTCSASRPRGAPTWCSASSAGG
ncbi:putative transcriptional regulator [Pseudomonas aeruginosa]|nr:putative transcriptional regulator [Pseudomonas aeruginosa]